MNKYFVYVLGAFSLFCLMSCNDPIKETIADSPTSGNLKVFCDKGLELQMKHQAYTFEKTYPGAKINLIYANESDAVNALYNDSCRTIIINRTLSKTEEEKFKSANIYITSMFVGKSAVALIVNPNAVDTTINIDDLAALIAGDTSGTIFKSVIFESEKTGTALYCMDSLLQGKTLGKNCYAASNINDLVDRISKSTTAIGVLDYVWISDRDDSLSKVIYPKIKLLGLAAKGNKNAYYPDQSNIQTDDYPFTRRMYMIRRGQDFSLAAGFITFVAGPNGQIMMLKSGLAPWRQPERVISVDMKPY
ncbi:MAG: substrate-binding domain-containing protein [Bacteroidota bacterium]|nr:substrate-binding domain-containing protein [Bacteroidota bacterium]